MRVHSTPKEHPMGGRLPNDLTPGVRRAQLSLLTSAYLRWITKYRPDQARVPAGLREGGQWTGEEGGSDSGGDGGGDAGTFDGDENALNVEISRGEVDTGEHRTGEYDIEFVGSRTIVKIDYSRALTGISTIDDTTKKLSETLGDTWPL